MNKFKVGQKVKVKDFYDIAGTFERDHCTHGLPFTKSMLELCGKTLTITNIRNSCVCTELVADVRETGNVFVEEWLEPVELKCTLADVFEYDMELADCFANQIRDDWNIIALDINHMIEDDELKENATYRTRHAKDIVLRLDPTHSSVDEWHTHAVIFEGYGYLDCICSSCVAEILCKKTA